MTETTEKNKSMISDLTIREDNKMRPYIENTLLFAREYPGWHSYQTNCIDTLRSIRWLASRGFIQVNQYFQFRATNWNGSPMEIDQPADMFHRGGKNKLKKMNS